ncbi:MAG: succinate dehydrogenase cytochrome b subunit [Elusimicrobia bacterium]|nr:succinate dehydrogenase cytochrome b subunit [Elusimicrobiota bacterium]
MKACERVRRTSIAKKQVVALTGLALVFFLFTHLAGNLQMLKGAKAFDDYAAFLASQGPLLWLAEAGLALVFLVHIVWGLTVTLQNVRARPVAYAVTTTAGGRTAGSATMRYSGSILLVFLVVHIVTFKLMGPETGHGSLFQWVTFNFKHPAYMGFYLAAMLFLLLHLSHGIQSAFQTLGVNHPRYTPYIRCAGWLVALILAGGFGALPVWAYLR